MNANLSRWLPFPSPVSVVSALRSLPPLPACDALCLPLISAASTVRGVALDARDLAGIVLEAAAEESPSRVRCPACGEGAERIACDRCMIGAEGTSVLLGPHSFATRPSAGPCTCCQQFVLKV